MDAPEIEEIEREERDDLVPLEALEDAELEYERQSFS